MGTRLQARILHHLAISDQFDGVGRIFLLDARQALRKPELTSSDITDLWQEYYQDETAEEKQFNLILVYFDGKASVRNVRSVRSAPLELNEFSASKNGDVIEPEDYRNPDSFPANKPEENVIW
jgi:hypothetical protein